MPSPNATGIDKVNRSRTAAARLFVAAEIPEEARKKLGDRLKMYQEYVRYIVPEENWHVTFLFLGVVNKYEKCREAMVGSMPQVFLPTIAITHVGRGRQQQQLWAFAKPTALLQTIKQQLLDRTEECIPGFTGGNPQAGFAPHIKLANLRNRPVSALMADSPLIISWPIKRLILFRSKVYFGEPKYKALGTINL